MTPNIKARVNLGRIIQSLLCNHQQNKSSSSLFSSPVCYTSKSLDQNELCCGFGCGGFVGCGQCWTFGFSCNRLLNSSWTLNRRRCSSFWSVCSSSNPYSAPLVKTVSPVAVAQPALVRVARSAEPRLLAAPAVVAAPTFVRAAPVVYSSAVVKSVAYLSPVVKATPVIAPARILF